MNVACQERYVVSWFQGGVRRMMLIGLFGLFGLYVSDLVEQCLM